MSNLIVKNISKAFDQNKIIDNIDIELRDGEIVSLLGASGGGKTTLFNIIAGISLPDSGNILLDGENITGQSGLVSYMLQKDMLLPYKTVLDNVALPLIIKGMKKKEAREKALSYFEQFGLSGYENKYPNAMSGGMRQRAAFLRTYLFSGKVAILDEPFSALDMLTKGELHGWYMDIMNELKLSTLFITHDIDEAIMLSDRIYILTGKPGTITKEIVIEGGKNKLKDFNLTQEFLGYKQQIVNALKNKNDYKNV
ncbi:MAG: ABC transporter ATP-binding protein [Lachnospiraceae bacterium]|nr:ABC transporter ATP-binding protein [Lachnospiraceae bacterium]